MTNKQQKPKYKIVRNHTISFKVTDDELALIHLYASKKPHDSISSYVRDKALRYHARTLEIKEEDLEQLKAVLKNAKEVNREDVSKPFNTPTPTLSKENELKIALSEQFLEIMHELSPLIAENGYVNYRDGGDLLLKLKSLIEEKTEDN